MNVGVMKQDLIFVGQVKPLELWYAVRFLNGEVAPYEQKNTGRNCSVLQG